MVGTWQRLDHVELSSSSSEIASNTFTAKDNLKIILYHINTGGYVNPKIRFNGDSGSNYASRYSDNGGSDSTSSSQSEIDLRAGELSSPAKTVIYITNIANKEKSIISETVIQNTAGAGNIPARAEVVGKWTNTSAQITSLKFIKSASGSFASGSYVTIFGATGDTVTDEKTTLADATSDTTQVAGTSDITDLTWTQTVGSSTSDTFYVLKDTSNDLMDIKASGNCGTDGSPSIAYATLSEALGTTYWRMRFKLVFNTVTAESTGGKSFFTNFFFVDDGSSWADDESGFGFRFIADAGSTQTQFYSMTSGTASGTTMSYTPSSGSTIYVEISWEGGTATANFYSDSGYSSRVGSTTANATRSGTFSGLKYPQIVLRQDNGGNGVMEIDMSNLEIINRVSTAPNAGTQYRETDTRKIYRKVATSSPFYETSFTSNTGWNTSQSDFTFDTSTDERLEFVESRSNHRTWYDLGSAKGDSDFTMRFEINLTSFDSNNGGASMTFICVSSNDGILTSTNDSLNAFNYSGNGWRQSIADGTRNDATGNQSGNLGSISAGDTHYMEMKRSGTTYTLSRYTDNTYSATTWTADKTIGSGVTGLRYIKIQNGYQGNKAGWIDNIKFYETATTIITDPWKERGSA
jgi:hypothetical protein